MERKDNKIDKTVSEVLEKEDEFNNKKYLENCDDASRESLFVKKRTAKE
jgi:hypothetical protein